MRKTILLADDSVTIQKVVELTFLDEDFEVVAVSNGTQALARLGELDPDLVIADVHMPGASGLEVCRQSKHLHPRTPVLLLVGTFEPFDQGEATGAGSDDYLKKPFDSQELLRRAKELIDRGSTVEALPAAIAPPLAAPSPTPALAPIAAEPALGDDLMAWDGASFGLEGDGSTLIEPSTDLAAEAAIALPTEAAPLDLGPPPELAMASVPMPSEPAMSRAVYGEPAAPSPSVAPAVVASAGELRLSDRDVERIARRLVELLGPQILREVAWEVVPDLAEVAIRSRIRELEGELE